MSDSQRTSKKKSQCQSLPFTALSPLDSATLARRKLQRNYSELQRKKDISRGAGKKAQTAKQAIPGKREKKHRTNSVKYSTVAKKSTVHRNKKKTVKNSEQTKARQSNHRTKSVLAKTKTLKFDHSYRLFLGILIFLVMIGFVFMLWPDRLTAATGDQTFLTDINLSNLDHEHFESKLKSNIPQLLSEQKIEVKVGEAKYAKSIYDLGITLNTDFIYQQALEKNVKRDKENSVYFWQSKPTGKLPAIQLSFAYQIDEERLATVVNNLASEYDSTYADAKVTGFDTDIRDFIIDPERPEIVIDKEHLELAIRELIDQNTIVSGILDIPVSKYRAPEVTAEQLHSKLGYIDEAVSYLSYRAEGRDQNLRRACELFQGYILKPGETISYNGVLGPQSVENGFAEGYAVADGIPYLEIGGGLCQTSTILFQAAVKADLDIVERHNHGDMIPYANYGQDAMVADWADLKIANNTPYPYAFYTYFNDEEGSVLFAVYGPPVKDGMKIDIVSEKIEDIPASDKVEYRVNTDLNPGEKKEIRARKDGSVWTTYKVYYKDGEEVERKYLADSYYDAYSAIYESNSKPIGPIGNSNVNQ